MEINGDALLDSVVPGEALAEGEVLPGIVLRDGMLLLLWASETPDDETPGSDRYWRTSGGQDILAIKCRLTLVGLGVLMVKGPTAQVASGIPLHFGRLTANFTLLLSITAFNSAR